MMIIDWNIKSALRELEKCHRAANDNYMTGYNQWPCKQDLYRVKFALDEMLKDCPSFSGEEEWLEEQRLEREKIKVWKTISK